MKKKSKNSEAKKKTRTENGIRKKDKAYEVEKGVIKASQANTRRFPIKQVNRTSSQAKRK